MSEYDPRMRHEGCRAILLDDGEGQPTVPVCMGGIAIGGCNNAEVCAPAYYEKVEAADSDDAHMLNIIGDSVTGVWIVPRHPISLEP